MKTYLASALAVGAFTLGYLVATERYQSPEQVDQKARADRLQHAYWDALAAYGRMAEQAGGEAPNSAMGRVIEAPQAPQKKKPGLENSTPPTREKENGR